MNRQSGGLTVTRKLEILSQRFGELPLEKPFAAYTGDEPYIFVCYAHEDSAIVYPEIQWLHEHQRAESSSSLLPPNSALNSAQE